MQFSANLSVLTLSFLMTTFSACKSNDIQEIFASSTEKKNQELRNEEKETSNDGPPEIASLDNENLDVKEEKTRILDDFLIENVPGESEDQDLNDVERVISYDVPSDTLLEVDYYSQWNNLHNPKGTCGLTSAAMLMNYWDKSSPKPDEIYERYGGDTRGQRPDTLAEIYGDYGFKSHFSRVSSRSDIKQLLNKGFPVVLHGDFTVNGHIILIKGYNHLGFIVNDPAGNWDRCYRCEEYNEYKRNGYNLIYTYEEMSEKVIGEDGEIWISYIEGYYPN